MGSRIWTEHWAENLYSSIASTCDTNRIVTNLLKCLLLISIRRVYEKYIWLIFFTKVPEKQSQVYCSHIIFKNIRFLWLVRDAEVSFTFLWLVLGMFYFCFCESVAKILDPERVYPRDPLTGPGHVIVTIVSRVTYYEYYISIPYVLPCVCCFRTTSLLSSKNSLKTFTVFESSGFTKHESYNYFLKEG